MLKLGRSAQHVDVDGFKPAPDFADEFGHGDVLYVQQRHAGFASPADMKLLIAEGGGFQPLADQRDIDDDVFHKRVARPLDGISALDSSGVRMGRPEMSTI